MSAPRWVESLAGTEREAIAVFRSDDVVEGWILKQEGRISDRLNDGDSLQVGTETRGGLDWLEVNRDEVIAVAPAPRPPSPDRVRRRHHPVEFEAGPYTVKGTVHLPVAADPRRYVSSTGRRWLPITQCTVSAADGEWAVEVVIVNLDHASRREANKAAPKFG
jgi:hypothetical protein